MSKKLQLQRNNTSILSKRSEIITSYKNAVSADTEDKFVDGQVFVIRYTDDNTNKIGAAICTVNVVGDSKYLTVSDCDLYEKIIDNEQTTEKAIETLNDTIGGDMHLKINFDNVPLVSADTTIKDKFKELIPVSIFLIYSVLFNNSFLVIFRILYTSKIIS